MSGDGATQEMIQAGCASKRRSLGFAAMTCIALFLAFLFVGGSARPVMAFSFCCPECPCLEPGSVALAPTYAAAKVAQSAAFLGEWGKKFAEWAKHLAIVGNIIKILTFVSGLLTDITKLFTDKLDTLIATKHITATLKAKRKELENIDKKTTVTETKKAFLQSRVGSKSEPTDADAVLCNTIVARQAQAVMQQYVEVCAQEVTEAIMNTFRGAGVDGTSPQRAALDWMLSCPPASLDVFGPRTKSRIDAAPPECIQEGFEDADINVHTLAGGKVTLEKPPLVTHTLKGADGKPLKGADGKEITVQVPTPDRSLLGDETSDGDPEAYAAQQRWIAAFHYCYKAAGVRPTPPAAAAITTPDGLISSHQWDHCAAVQSAFIHQCAKMMCNNTRPNGSDEYTKQVVKATSTACQAAQDIGSDLPNGNCKRPLTSYQTEDIADEVCSSEQRATLGGPGAGDKIPNMLKSSDLCMSIKGWRGRQRAQEMNNFVKGMAGIHDLKSCWPAVNIRPFIKSAPVPPT